MAKQSTLIEQAKALSIRGRKVVREVTDDEIDLVIAYINNEVSHTAAAQILKVTTGNNMYCFIARAIKQGVDRGYVTITKKGK